jgi:ATP-binding cassette subfamily B protein
LESGVGLRFVLLLGAQLGQYVAFIASWWAIGNALLLGHASLAWYELWLLLLMSYVLLRALANFLQGRVLVTFGARLKRRLLAGALHLSPEEGRGESAGRHVARVIEAEALDSPTALEDTLGAVFGFAEFIGAGVILARGVAPGLFVGMLLCWAVAMVAMTAAYIPRRRQWTEARIRMTTDLVEKMLGQRTRLVQQPPEQRHRGEDEAMQGLLMRSRVMDRLSILLSTLPERGWLVIAVGALLIVVLGAWPSTTALIATIGGILLAFRGLQRVEGGMHAVGAAVVAWWEVARLFRAAADVEPPPISWAIARGAAAPSSGTVVDAKDLAYRYAGAPKPVLNSCSISLEKGERGIIEGPAGSGKSTLGLMLGGLVVPDSGYCRVGGWDRSVVRLEGWRRHVSLMIPFAQNHVLSASLAFNLLMGREWPPTREDLAAAESLCRELGLGELLERMPGGLFEMVGDCGWQLSHGERSRMFVARALLQDAPVAVLDDAFSALDPQTALLVLDCVSRHARTLLLIEAP